MMDKLGRQSNILILIFKDPFAGKSSMLILESVDTRMAG
jgi:hypothetical protein